VGSKLYPGGSTSWVRGDVLAALGVFKVATAQQLWRLTRPAWQDETGLRNTLRDLQLHGLVVSDGWTQGPSRKPPKRGQKAAAVKKGPGNREPKSKKLWRLTPAGLDAAAQLLTEDRSMGGTARGAGKHGAGHAMAVNEAILAFIQPRPQPAAVDDGLDDVDQEDGQEDGIEQAGVIPQQGERPPGIGTIASWTTEVVLPISGSVSAPSKGSPRADAILAAPETDPPLPFLCLEVDNGTEPPERIALKLEKYRRFFRRTTKDYGGEFGETRIPYWRTLYADDNREGHPPVAIVFTGGGQRSLTNRMTKVRELTRDYWGARWQSYGGWRSEASEDDGWREYNDTVPILATTLPLLKQHGPYGAIWWRYGYRHKPLETLAAALVNHNNHDAYMARNEADRQRREAEEAERRRRNEADRQRLEDEDAARQQAAAAEEEARRRQCQRCGQPRHDDRWGQDPILQQFPAPDGLHCAPCRYQLARSRSGIVRRIRRFIDDT
jgi:protein involved in plasmid replication-relaxation